LACKGRVQVFLTVRNCASVCFLQSQGSCWKLMQRLWRTEVTCPAALLRELLVKLEMTPAVEPAELKFKE
jgi:hypothetical protein